MGREVPDMAGVIGIPGRDGTPRRGNAKASLEDGSSNSVCSKPQQRRPGLG